MDNTEVVKIINIKTDQAINTVKELKQYINELKDDLVKTDRTSEEYKNTLDALADAQTKLIQVTNDSRNAANYAEGSYRALNQELVQLRNEYKLLSEEERNNASVGGAMLSRINELDTELKSIDADMGLFGRNVGHYQLALEALNKTYANQRQELKALKTAMESLDEGSAEYQQAFNRAAEITHNLAYQQEMLKYSSNDLGDQLSNMRGIATHMVAGFSAVNAAMGLFGEKNEDVQKAMLKVQQAMAIVQGLQGMDGLLKRTKGLSTAMKVWFNTSKQVTTQTIAQTTAVQGETVATQGATVAQKGLNAAMKANPIGVIVTAIMALVTAYTLLKGKIDNLIQGNEKLQTILGKVRGVLSAFGTTLKNAVLVPIQELVNYLKTLGVIMYDVFTGNWKKIGEDVKEGIDNAKKIVVDAGKDIATSYQKGITKVQEEFERKRAETRAKELADVIKDNDAKLGSDWKYTESGKTIYEEYLDAKIKSYKKDSEEYKEALRDKDSYEREYNEKAEKQRKEAEQKRLKAAEDAKKQREQIEKNYISSIQKKYGTSIRETVDTYKTELNTIKDYLTEQVEKTKEPLKTEIKNLLKDIDSSLKEVNQFDLLNLENSAEPLGKSFELLQKLFKQNIDTITKTAGEETERRVNDEIIRLYEKTIVPNVEKENKKLQTLLDNQLADINFGIFMGGGSDKEMDKAELVYQSTIQQLTNLKEHYQKVVQYVDDNGLIPSDVYDEAKLTLIQIDTAIQQAGDDYINEINEIKSKAFEIDVTKIQQETDKAVKMIQDRFDINTGGINDTFWSKLFNVPVSINEQLEATNQIFDAQIDGLQKLKDAWDARQNDESLSYEQRLEAQENFNTVSAELNDTLLEKEKANAEARQELTNQWVQGIQDAVNATSNLLGSVADAWEATVEAQVKAGKMTEKEADEQFKNIKSMRIAEAIINTLAGSIGAFLQASATYPAPYGQIIGGVTAAAVTAAGVAQIAKIASTSRNGGSSSANASVSVPQADYDFSPTYTESVTRQEDTDNLRNAMSEVNLSVSVSEIDDVQNRVRVRQGESSF